MSTPFTFDALHPAATLALDASAGTGKTHTLTTIALRLIAEGRVTIEQLLIVTFTNAATAELRVRLLGTLRDALLALDGKTHALDEHSANWLTDGNDATLHARRSQVENAIQTFDDASILTIHGFCQRMLTFVGVSAGLSIDTAVTDDDEVALQDTLDDLAASVIATRNPLETAFLLDGAALGRTHLAELAKQVLQLPELRLVDDHWHDEDLTGPNGLTDAFDRIFAGWTDAFAKARLRLPHTANALHPLISAFIDDPFFAQNRRQRSYIHANVPKAAEALATFLLTPHALPPTGFDAKTKGIQPDAPYLWFTGQALARANLHGEPPDTPLIEVGERLTDAHHTVITQARNLMAHAIWQRYQAHRANRQVLTYDDLLRQLHQALTDPKRQTLTRALLRSQYTMALIDEFQDTDAVQWGIFSSVFTNEDPLIVIGDPKQAIYQFRGADVATYLRARDAMRHVYTLDTNWRSDEAHVAAINAVFESAGAFETYGINYVPSRPTHPNRLDSTELASGVNVRTFAKDDAGSAQVVGSIVEDMAAHAVTLLAGTTLNDNGQIRAITPRDIAVLVRTNRLARQVQTAFHARGIPAAIQRGGSVYASQEAQALHQLLAAIHSPHAMPIVCGAAATKLIKLPAVLLAAINDGTATSTELATFTTFTTALTTWQTLWRQHGVFTAVMAATSMFTPDGDGQRMLMNVRHLAELLAAAEQQHALGSEALLAWFAAKRGEVETDGYRADGTDELRLDGNDDAVRIATIHGAKGLEYPIVFTGDLWRQGPNVRAGRVVFTDPDATPHAKPTLDVALPLFEQPERRSRALAKRDSQAEQVRLAYVALTRAAHATVIWCPNGKRDDTSALGAVMQHLPAEKSYAELFAQFATEHAAPITVTHVTTSASGQYTPPNVVIPMFRTRTQQRISFDTPFRHTSFTALTRHHQAHASSFAVARNQSGDDDRDELLADVEQDGITLPLANFPRGTRAGNLLHHVFETLDFTNASQDTLKATLREQAAISRFTELNVDEAAHGILQVLHTPLGQRYANTSLHQIPRHCRADEMGFTIPLAKRHHTVTLHAFAPVLNQSANPLLKALGTQLEQDVYRIPIAGYLNGSIDCLLRLPNGQYVVVDYKSNYIGDLNGDTHLTCYAPTTALANTMTEHLYSLQALLYLIVTHRYLSHRVTDYNPAKHLAGAAYLFVRGMIGETTPETDGMRYGVASVTLEPELLEQLNAILAAGQRS